MRRRDFIRASGGAVMWPLMAHAQHGDRLRRLGVLIALTESNSQGQTRIRAFRQRLEELGWVEGRNISIDYRWPGGNAERLRSSAAELVGLRPDVIFAGNTTALEALHRSGVSLPIVFAQVADPVARGFVPNIARPGGNITGFANQEHAIAAKWAELIREVAPRTAHIGMIYDPASEGQKYQPEIERALPPNIKLIPMAMHSRPDLEDAIKRMAAERNSALIVLSGPLTAIHRDWIISLATNFRLPLIHPYQYYTTAGALMSYGPDLVDQYRRAADYVDRVLKGEKPGDLPVQFPTKYIFAINLRTAKTLGITILPTLVARADEVIE